MTAPGKSPRAPSAASKFLASPYPNKNRKSNQSDGRCQNPSTRRRPTSHVSTPSSKRVPKDENGHDASNIAFVDLVDFSEERRKGPETSSIWTDRATRSLERAMSPFEGLLLRRKLRTKANHSLFSGWRRGGAQVWETQRNDEGTAKDGPNADRRRYTVSQSVSRRAKAATTS